MSSPVGAVAQPARRIVQLRRGHAEIEQHAVGRLDADGA